MRKQSARVPVLALFLIMGALQAAPQAVSFLQSAQSIDAYDFVEVSVQVTQPDVKNPFTACQRERHLRKAWEPAAVGGGFLRFGGRHHLSRPIHANNVW